MNPHRFLNDGRLAPGLKWSSCPTKSRANGEMGALCTERYSSLSIASQPSLSLSRDKSKANQLLITQLSHQHFHIYFKASISVLQIQIPFCRFTIFRVFPFSIKNSTNRPKFTVFLNKKIKIWKSREFLQCSSNTSPGVNKQNGRSANISSHWRAEKGIQTAKVWPQKANKATVWRKSSEKIICPAFYWKHGRIG